MSTLRTVLVIAGVATGLGLAVGALSGVVQAQVRRARDELFEVSPGCQTIRFRGLPDGASEVDKFTVLAKARAYYFTPMIDQARKEGLSVQQTKLRILEDLFPECTWPPPELFSSQQAIYLVLGGWLTLEAMRGLTCDPLEEAPFGMVCIQRNGAFTLERQDM